MNRVLLAFSMLLMSSGCSEMMEPKFEIGEYVEVDFEIGEYAEVDVEGLVGRVDHVDCMDVAILPEHKNAPCSYWISLPNRAGDFTQVKIKQSHLSKATL